MLLLPPFRLGIKDLSSPIFLFFLLVLGSIIGDFNFLVPRYPPTLLESRVLGCSASFVHATFVDEIWKTISNLEFRRLDPRKQNFLDFRRSIAALVKTAIFLEISGFFTRNLM